MEKKDLIKEIVELDSYELYHKYLVGQEVWYFKKYLQKDNYVEHYDEFRKHIAKSLKVHFNNVAIIGSAKTGFSLAPHKHLKKFNSNSNSASGSVSDIDLVIVSRDYFQSLWSSFLEPYYKRKYSDFSPYAKDIFKGFITIKDPPVNLHPNIDEWIKTVDECLRDLQMQLDIEHEINYRIYQSWEAVENYHYFGFEQLKSHYQNKHNSEIKIAKSKQKTAKRVLKLLYGIIKSKENENN